LRNGEQAAADIFQRQIHFARGVGEDPVAEHAVGEPLSFDFGIATLDSDQGENSRTDRADGFAADGDARACDALDKRYHARVILNLTLA
jgi:hypothetical protein